MANIWEHVTNETYEWADPATGAVVKFRAKLILPVGHGDWVPKKVPLAVYFHSMGEKIDSVLGMANDWQKNCAGAILTGVSWQTEKWLVVHR